jgi:hypothetical protein
MPLPTLPTENAAAVTLMTLPDDSDECLVGFLVDLGERRHKGACVLVRLEFIGDRGLLEVIDCDPRITLPSSAVGASLRSSECDAS